MLPSKTDIEKLANNFIESDKKWEGSVIVHDIEEEKPICVFGILNTSLGLKIREEMMLWLPKHYSIIEVYHNGKCYEYPPIKLAQKLCLELGVPYTLYVHTKGAFNITIGQAPVRDIWKNEFSTDKRFAYLNAIDTTEATVVAPYISDEGHTWYNGFFCNKAAWGKKKIEKNTDRYYFEHMFTLNDNIKLIGIIKEGMSAVEAVQAVKDYLIDMIRKNAAQEHALQVLVASKIQHS
jgi:hypothetical protein